ncbi:MAG: hypothetical protein JWR09_576, partial [Mucilaginibacter sp.]|nr:hypothetical protein [Mucilaginibacter sp.]
EVVKRPINQDTFLPGLLLENGKIIIDTDKLLYPGDILHEAGHPATMPPGIRETMIDNLENNDLNQGGELMAIAWSYAACVHLNIDPLMVFHPHGYKGWSKSLAETFTGGGEMGVPLLQWTGMTYEARKAKELNVKPFPHMVCWLREN